MHDNRGTQCGGAKVLNNLRRCKKNWKVQSLRRGDLRKSIAQKRRVEEGLKDMCERSCGNG